jgi:hypothetical protein
MAGGKKGVRKTVGRARKTEGQRPVVRMFYVQKPSGGYALRFRRVAEVVEEAAAEPTAESAGEA